MTSLCCLSDGTCTPVTTRMTHDWKLQVESSTSQHELSLYAIVGNARGDVYYLFCCPQGAPLKDPPALVHELLLFTPMVPLKRAGGRFQSLLNAEWKDFLAEPETAAPLFSSVESLLSREDGASSEGDESDAELTSSSQDGNNIGALDDDEEDSVEDVTLEDDDVLEEPDGLFPDDVEPFV